MSGWQVACAELGFELHEVGLPLMGVARSWRAQRGERLVSLRVEVFHDEPYMGVHVPFTTPLRCGLQASTLAPPGEGLGEPIQVSLPHWHARAHRPKRARHLLNRFGDVLAGATQRGRELSLDDRGLTVWFVDMPDDADELVPRIEVAEHVASLLDAVAARVKPPRWVRRVRASWAAFAERRHLEVEPDGLTMRGVARAGASYRGSHERKIALSVREHDHADPALGVTVELTRPVSRGGELVAPAPGGDLLHQLLGRRTFGPPGRFVVTAGDEADAAALLAPGVRDFAERLPPAVTFVRLDEHRLEVGARELVDEAQLDAVLDAALELAALLEETAPELGPAPEGPDLSPLATFFGPPAPPTPTEARSARRVAFLMAAVVLSLVVVPLAYIELTRPEVGDHCVRHYDCGADTFCLKEDPRPRRAVPSGASPFDAQIHEMTERIVAPQRRRVPVDGYCSAHCTTDDDCPDAMRCAPVRSHASSPFSSGEWVIGDGVAARACVR